MSGVSKLTILLCTLLLGFYSYATAQEPFRVMFYNIENLYDTINNPKTQDEEFTPDGKLHWGGYRYKKKIEDVGKVISSLGGKYPPAIVGLCEIENGSVVDDLVKNSSLAKHKYLSVATNSKDARGSNIALLYQRDQMRLLQKKSYTPTIYHENSKTTRDILHVVGQIVNGDTLDIFVCHYPSRSEGIAKSNPKRIAVSELLRQKVDSLYKKRKNANIVIMGDFNDYPYDQSMKSTLGAKSLEENIDRKQLYNMFLHYGKKIESIASYKYKGKWGYLDQFVVSGNLLNRTNTTYIVGDSASVYKPQYLLEEDEKHGGHKPLRTYSGWTYLGGTSDHLPIYLDLHIEE